MPEEEKTALRQEILVQIGFFQHERLVHLIVLATVSVLFLLSIFAVLTWLNIFFFIFSCLLTVLLTAYVIHYFTLENGVQKLYEYYDMTKDKQ